MLAPYYKGQTKFQLGDNINLFDFTESTNVAHAHHLAAAALLTTVEREEQGQIAPLSHEKVDGEAFFITNDSPMYFWDFTRTAWRHLGDTTMPNQIWTINKDFGLIIATLFEWIFWIFQLGVPNLTRQKVKFSCMTRYYSIEKAKRRLGYRPVVGITEGLQRGVDDCVRRGVIAGSPEETQRLSAESKKSQ
jgi:sterol-4alpha-carboxylate 3-dehydrogenase (decarboxylating)